MAVHGYLSRDAAAIKNVLRRESRRRGIWKLPPWPGRREGVRASTIGLATSRATESGYVASWPSTMTWWHLCGRLSRAIGCISTGTFVQFTHLYGLDLIRPRGRARSGWL
jgi:hypothetical protein